ncbi:DUF2254 domain-containing protein [Leifsonia soli]|uniref:Putative membrane protein n=1 Tax=Leifsonia soli TaxID=582665 RepID=A0A852T0X2_9MICO|nr:DUF2254 domain-containing protein [Leifsonia soli]NYD74575.1 putative membrane protein [Leifsonia soli]
MHNPLRTLGRAAAEGVRSRLWPVPVLGVAVALVLGFLIPGMDARVDGRLPGWLDALVFGGDASAARTVLDAIATSLMTVTALTFSLTVVTLQLASSQFSPRLLRTFTKDLFVQTTLALFLGTFTFSLTVLRSVRSSQESAEPFVPRIAITVSFVLAIASVVALVLFLGHLAKQIRVETMLAEVRADTSATASSVLAPLDASPPAVPLQPGPNAVQLDADRSGFLLSVDTAAVAALAAEAGGFIAMARSTGDFVVAGTPVATVWKDESGPLADDELATLRRGLVHALSIGPERTGTQDVAFGLRQLVDVAVKALSPGINDPTTAVHALGHVSALLCELGAYRLGTVTASDADGIVRAEFLHPDFSDYLELAVAQPLHYGAGDPMVVSRLLELLRDLAQTSPPERMHAIIGSLERITEVARAQDAGAAERNQHDALVREVRRLCAGRSSAGLP